MSVSKRRYKMYTESALSTFEVDFEAADDQAARAHVADLVRLANVPSSSEITIERPNGTRLRIVLGDGAET